VQDALQEEPDDAASENGDGYGERELLRTHWSFLRMTKDNLTTASEPRRTIHWPGREGPLGAEVSQRPSSMVA
jgi:hypothetical protein